ncbi:unnamed protein product [Mucor hiemalis]
MIEGTSEYKSTHYNKTFCLRIDHCSQPLRKYPFASRQSKKLDACVYHYLVDIIHTFSRSLIHVVESIKRSIKEKFDAKWANFIKTLLHATSVRTLSPVDSKKSNLGQGKL